MAFQSKQRSSMPALYRFFQMIVALGSEKGSLRVESRSRGGVMRGREPSRINRSLAKASPE